MKVLPDVHTVSTAAGKANGPEVSVCRHEYPLPEVVAAFRSLYSRIALRYWCRRICPSRELQLCSRIRLRGPVLLISGGERHVFVPELHTARLVRVPLS